jgi:hypothetical protein
MAKSFNSLNTITTLTKAPRKMNTLSYLSPSRAGKNCLAAIVLFSALLMSNSVKAQCIGGQTVTFITKYTSCAGSSASWDGASGGSFSEDASGNITITWSISGTFRMKRTFPCGSTQYTPWFTVNAKPATPATWEVSQQNGCGYVTLNYSGGNSSTYWQTTAGGTNEAYPITMAVTSAQTYYARTKDGYGCWSDGRSITVSSIPQNPVGGSLSGGTDDVYDNHYGTITRTLSLSGHSGNVIEWRYTENGGSPQVVANTSSSLTVTISNSSASGLSRSYWAVVAINGCEATSSSANVTLRGLPASSITVCAGQTTSHSITNNIGTPGNSAEFVFGSGGTIINGTSSNFTVNWTNAGTFTLKRVFPGYDTEIVESTVTVLGLPAAPSSGELTQTGGCGYVALNYNGGVYDTYWQTVSDGIDQTYRTSRFVAVAQNYYARIKGSNGCWSNAISINVSNIPAVPVGGTANGGTDDTYDNHYGSITRTLTVSGIVGTVQEWRYSENGGSEVSVPSSASTSISVTMTNSSTAQVSRLYRAIILNNGCTAPSSTTPVTLRGLPASTMTVCVGDISTHSITNNIGTVGNEAQFAIGTGGSISNGGLTEFTVTWTAAGTFTLKRVFPGYDTEIVEKTVTVLAQPAAPLASELTQVGGCGFVTLSYTGSVRHLLANRSNRKS